jgi:hypothetical protein
VTSDGAATNEGWVLAKYLTDCRSVDIETGDDFSANEPHKGGEAFFK